MRSSSFQQKFTFAALGLSFVLLSANSFGQSPPHVWSIGLGGGNDDYLNAVATDGEGNVFATGAFQSSTFYVGSSSLARGAGAEDVFLVKIDQTDGSCLWSTSFESSLSAEALALGVDSAGDVVIAGWFRGTLDLGGGELTSAGGTDIFVAKLDGATGAHVWSVRFGGTDKDEVRALAVNDLGEIFVGGGFWSPLLAIGGHTLSNPTSTANLFVAKIGEDGAPGWAIGYGGPQSDEVLSIAIDSQRDLFVTGLVTGTVDLGGGDLTNSTSAVFIAKYDGATGEHLLSNVFGSISPDVSTGEAIAVDGSDNVYLTGEFKGAVDFGGGTLTSPPSTTIPFVASFSSNGSHRWSSGYGEDIISPVGERGMAISVRSDGTLVCAGRFWGIVDFGAGPLKTVRYPSTYVEEDMYLAGFDTAGTALWSMSFGGAKPGCGSHSDEDGWQDPHGIGFLPNGDVIVGGTIENPTDFGGGIIYTHESCSYGHDEGFLVRYTLPVVSIAEDELLACPAGDADTLVVTVDFADGSVTSTVPADSMIVETVGGGGVAVFTDIPIAADADATSGNGYQTTVHVPLFIGGCSEGAAVRFPVRVNGRTVGTAFASVKSPDVDGSGAVDGGDQAAFISSWGDCAGDPDYDPCVDFVISSSPSCVGVGDFGFFGAHHLDEAPNQPLWPASADRTLPVGGSVSMVADAGNPGVFVVSAHGLDKAKGGRVQLDLAPGVRFDSWTQEDQVLSVAKVRDDAVSVLFVAASEGLLSGSAELGRLRIHWDRSSHELDGDAAWELSGEVFDADGTRMSLVAEGAWSGGLHPVRDHQDVLRQNVPNPFNPVTTIRFSMGAAGNAHLAIYDARGVLVRTLVDEHRAAGEYPVVWDGRNDSGQPVASGTYFYRLTTPSHQEARKLVLLK